MTKIVSSRGRWALVVLVCIIPVAGCGKRAPAELSSNIERLKSFDPVERSAAAARLGDLGDGRAVKALIICLDDVDDVRESAQEALIKIGKPSVELLIRSLKDKNRNVRGLAAEVLGKIRDKRAVEPLVECLRDRDEDLWVRVRAAEAVGNIGDASTVGPLVLLLEDEEPDVCESAANALVKIGEPAVEPLITCLQDGWRGARSWQGNWARGIVARALGNIRDHRAVEPLIECLRDEVSWVRVCAAEAMGNIGDARAVGPLVLLLEDKEPDVRESAAKALGKIGETSVEPLIVCLRDQRALVRASAAEALSNIRDGRALEPLITCLKDEDPVVRGHAARGLGCIGAARAVEPLMICLKDEDSHVRQSVAEALGNIGDARALPALVAVLPDWDANRAIGEALEKLAWQPTSTSDKVYLWICKGDTQSLRAHFGETREVLIADIRSGGSRKVENAVYTFMCLGSAEMIPELVSILDESVLNIPMAETYLNSGNAKLEKAARDWASRHGLLIREGSAARKASWGGGL